MASTTVRFTSAFLLLIVVGVAKAGGGGDRSRVQKRAVTTLASLETVVETLSEKVQSLQADLMSINDELQDKLIHQSQKRHGLEARVNSLENASASTPAVSFFAKYTPDLFADALNASAALVVNTLVSNEGHAYDNHSGVFTAPLSGTYAFFLTDAASVNHATVMQLDLVVDPGHEVACSARTNSLQGGSPASGSCQAVLGLRAGQTVWLRNLWQDAKYWGGLTTFSGVLLHVR